MGVSNKTSVMKKGMIMSKMKFKLASPKEVVVFMTEAKEFIEQTGMFDSVKSTAVTAVAEYKANQKGLTLYVQRISE